VQVGSAKYFYARDHLGSIREVVDNAGAMQARYNYDPYGRRTRVGGPYSGEFDFGYTGNYFNPSTNGAAGGLQLALYRAYDPNLGRWLNRDPIGEQGGINLYSFAYNDPVGLIDPLGLDVGGRVGPGYPDDGYHSEPKTFLGFLRFLFLSPPDPNYCYGVVDTGPFSLGGPKCRRFRTLGRPQRGECNLAKPLLSQLLPMVRTPERLSVKLLRVCAQERFLPIRCQSNTL
jgi:RHS repeat-associated protein